MTTDINKVLSSQYIDDPDDLEDLTLEEIIISTDKSIDTRLQALEQYYTEINDDIIEVITILVNMYNISGAKSIESFFYKICSHGRVSAFIKLEVAKSLLEYTEYISDEIIEMTEKTEINNRNNQRKQLGYKALDFVCYDLESIPTPCRVEAICMLMKSDVHYANADSYFREFIRDTKIDCDFRYKSILSLINIGSNEMRDKLCEKFSDNVFIQKMYSDFAFEIDVILKELQQKLCITNQKQFCQLLDRFSYENLKLLYKDEFPGEMVGRDTFIKSAQMTFLFYRFNNIRYRILAGQYLLQKCELGEIKRQQVERQLLEFAEDDSLEYNARADAADVLLRLGSLGMRHKCKLIIIELGKLGGVSRTIFDNAQNVHTEEVETSVQDALEFLASVPCIMTSGEPIDFGVVNEAITKILSEDRECLKVEGIGDEYCEHCNSVIIEKYKNFCSYECFTFFNRDDKIRISLNRIYLDRALYSKYNSTLANILIKVWSYIQTNDANRDEMIKRLLEELEEMAETCSTGFASRLINVISGFGEFNIRISWENQVVANFIGRINANARQILDSSSEFWTNKNLIAEVTYLWLLRHENSDIYKKIYYGTFQTIVDNGSTISDTTQVETQKVETQKIKAMTDFYLGNSIDKYHVCIETFAENVLNEITIPSSDYAARQSFSLFFRTYASKIREELYSEFKESITDSEFDMYIRKAYMQYDI